MSWTEARERLEALAGTGYSHKLDWSDIDHLRAALARIDEAEAVMKPFALVSTEFDRWQAKGSTTQPSQIFLNYAQARVAFEDFRRAAAFIGEKG